METAVMFLAVAGILLACVVAVWVFQRGLARDARPRTSSMGDAFGNLIDVFDPAQARASRDLKDQQNVGPVSKVPERDPDDPIQLTLGPDGNPRAVRIRRDR
ncbi:hypothetical protein EFK50_03980 [Nocardioides marmoriginsengisoli]|uniref:Uncharacterized protein n=1 Tax=Nocardioides marmoriginsengisoli TaxID=661483 RepID=A0A3N0CNT4_9ACTN|nr:hypothetical protein [Nocardioides marmoriginsengisoli]RNL65137.1 hypothetical protein EFK50_03980 [Nocardioides marmoriginsengisoli]